MSTATRLQSSTASTLSRTSLADAARGFAAAARSENTRRAYAGDLRRFAAWCAKHGLAALPAQPATLALYITHIAKTGRRSSTIRRAMAAIGQAHRLAGHASPSGDARVRDVERGIRRRLGTATKQVAPLLPEDLRSGLRRSGGARSVRDRAIVLLGFAAALRREELAALNVEDVVFEGNGLALRVRRSKTDPEGRGDTVAVPKGTHAPTCPVEALRSWLKHLPEAAGPLFRDVHLGAATEARISGRAVARAVKRVAKLAGLDPTLYSGHSLRAGLATAAARAGKPDRVIMRQGRWRSRATVDRYVRDARLWIDDNAADGIGL